MAPLHGKIDLRWAYYLLARQDLSRLNSATGVPGLNREDVYALPILIPPLAEQRAIAEVLDSIDAAIERTDDVIAATQRLRDALLHELLTRGVPGWHSSWNYEPGLGTIPASWEVVRLRDRIREGPTNGIYKPSPDYGSGSCLIRIDDFEPGNLVNAGNLSRIRVTEEEIRRYGVESGDILVNRVNSLSHIGKTVLIGTLEEPTLFESNMMRLRTDELIEPKFAEIVLLSDASKMFFTRRAKKAVQQASINQQDVGDLPVPLPPLLEQHYIVAVIDSVTAGLKQIQEERSGLHALKASTSDALLTGRVRVGV